MQRPLTLIIDAATGQEIVREMTDSEYINWQNNIEPTPSPPTKEDLLAELAALTEKINSFG